VAGPATSSMARETAPTQETTESGFFIYPSLILMRLLIHGILFADYNNATISNRCQRIVKECKRMSVTDQSLGHHFVARNA
jgi:hypothetical protein